MDSSSHRKRSISNTKFAQRGERFGRLMVLTCFIEFDKPVLKRRGSTVYAACDCGGFVKVPYTNLKQQLVSSCGCLRKETFYRMKEHRLREIRINNGRDPDLPLTEFTIQERNTFVATVGLETKKRDNFSCLLCEESPAYVESHHIIPWSVDPSKRFDPLNIATLCKSCHSNRAHPDGYTGGKYDKNVSQILIEKVASKYLS